MNQRAFLRHRPLTHTGAVNDAVAAVLAGAAEVSGWQEDLYRDLHSHPELSHQEHRTAGKAADRLTTAGFEHLHHGPRQGPLHAARLRCRNAGVASAC